MVYSVLIQVMIKYVNFRRGFSSGHEIIEFYSFFALIVLGIKPIWI